jgi:hypothetical protein
VLRHGAVAQAGNLRENESHSVGPLVPRGQFFDDPGVPEACASTKRTRSGSVTRAARVHEHALISAPKMAKICDYPAASDCSEAENGRTAAVTLCRLREIAGG